MSLRRIAIDKADKVFSIYIRLRDKKCVRCQSAIEINGQGRPVSHQCSHFFGRRMETVRFEERNCDTLCHGCHRFWEKEDREAYRDFKIRQLGQKGFEQLTLQAHQIGKKDRIMAYLYWKHRLKRDFGL